MKIKIFVFVIIATLGSGFTGCVTTNTGNTKVVEYGEYNLDELNTYGEWIYVEPYGRVWCPSVVDNWEPFYNGHWVYSGSDWVWVSYEPFGWIVYHYGNWTFSTQHRWMWIPGKNDWSPARVQWIQYGDYIGWSPFPPTGVNWPEPWEAYQVPIWKVVRGEDFNRENVGSLRLNRPPRDERKEQGGIERLEPDVKVVERFVKESIPTVRIEREPVKMEKELVKIDNRPTRVENNPKQTEKRKIHRLRIPEQENVKVERYRPKVEKEILIPRVKSGVQRESKKDKR
jgi:hypothetical protein